MIAEKHVATWASPCSHNREMFSAQFFQFPPRWRFENSPHLCVLIVWILRFPLFLWFSVVHTARASGLSRSAVCASCFASRHCAITYSATDAAENFHVAYHRLFQPQSNTHDNSTRQPPPPTLTNVPPLRSLGVQLANNNRCAISSSAAMATAPARTTFSSLTARAKR